MLKRILIVIGVIIIPYLFGVLVEYLAIGFSYIQPPLIITWLEGIIIMSLILLLFKLYIYIRYGKIN